MLPTCFLWPGSGWLAASYAQGFLYLHLLYNTIDLGVSRTADICFYLFQMALKERKRSLRLFLSNWRIVPFPKASCRAKNPRDRDGMCVHTLSFQLGAVSLRGRAFANNSWFMGFGSCPLLKCYLLRETERERQRQREADRDLYVCTHLHVYVCEYTNPHV